MLQRSSQFYTSFNNICKQTWGFILWNSMCAAVFIFHTQPFLLIVDVGRVIIMGEIEDAL